MKTIEINKIEDLDKYRFNKRKLSYDAVLEKKYIDISKKTNLSKNEFEKLVGEKLLKEVNEHNTKVRESSMLPIYRSMIMGINIPHNSYHRVNATQDDISILRDTIQTVDLHGQDVETFISRIISKQELITRFLNGESIDISNLLQGVAMYFGLDRPTLRHPSFFLFQTYNGIVFKPQLLSSVLYNSDTNTIYYNDFYTNIDNDLLIPTYSDLGKNRLPNLIEDIDIILNGTKYSFRKSKTPLEFKPFINTYSRSICFMGFYNSKPMRIGDRYFGFDMSIYIGDSISKFTEELGKIPSISAYRY